MNSHICHWSPSFRVAIDWRWKGLTDSQKQKKINSHHGIILSHCQPRGSHKLVQRDAIYVHSQTEKNLTNDAASPLLPMCWKLESDTLVKVLIRWDQSPRNSHRRPSKIGTNPQRRSIRRCYGDITLSIMFDGECGGAVIGNISGLSSSSCELCWWSASSFRFVERNRLRNMADKIQRILHKFCLIQQ